MYFIKCVRICFYPVSSILNAPKFIRKRKKDCRHCCHFRWSHTLSIRYISWIKWHKYRLLMLQNRNELYSYIIFFFRREWEWPPIKWMQSKWRWCCDWMRRGPTTHRKMWKKVIIPQQTLNCITKSFNAMCSARLLNTERDNKLRINRWRNKWEYCVSTRNVVVGIDYATDHLSLLINLMVARRRKSLRNNIH